MRRNGLVGLLTAMTLTTAACSATATPRTLPDGTAPQPTVVRVAGSLVQFDACDGFLDYVVSHGVDLVGPYGLDGGWPHPVWLTDVTRAAAEETAGGDGAGAPEHSETNVQVDGVDEPDMVKTDGERIVVLADGQLIVVDVTGSEPVETGRMPVHDLSVQSLFLTGDKVLLFGSLWTEGPMPLAAEGVDARIAPQGTSSLQIVAVDIAGEPEVERTMTIDGAFVSGRMVGDSVRVVMSSGPVGFEWSYPKGSGLRAEREATEANQEIIRDSTPENWIPYYYVTDGEGDVVDEGTLFDCERAAHPEEFSGLDMLSVVTIDLSDGLDVVDATGVLAHGQTVYASEESLYVATQGWETWQWVETGESDQPEGPETSLHRFDISDPALTTYAATGSVAGYLLNQFAMDEHDGLLRVASTTNPFDARRGGLPDSESRITILREIGDELIPIGTVDGLGETEQIYSVRFMGDVAYVVTFRQADPLYTVDLSNPRSPKVLGELKIPGYSAYLHPVGDDLLLGVGQDADDQGMVKGAQVSLFDVSDLTDPVRLDTYSLSEGTGSQVEYDHHAFLFWEGLAVIPMQQWWIEDGKDELFVGAVGLEVGDDGSLQEVDMVVHPGGEGANWDGRAQIMRSVVVGDSLYTISAKGVMQSELDGLEEQAWLDF